MKPEAHGIDDKFILRSQVVKQLKVNGFFTTVPATRWRMMHDMIADHVKYEEGLSGAEESHKLFKQAFQAIGEKSTYKALATYCTSLSAYYGSIKKEFVAAYKQEVKEYKAQQKIVRNTDLAGSELIVEGVQRAKRKAGVLASEKIQKINKRRVSTSSPPSHHTQQVVSLDKVEVPGSDSTVGTTLKQEGLRLHDLYKNGGSLSAQEINRMSSCLSCVLDLVDNSDGGQKLLFNNEQWEFLKAKFSSCRKVNVPLKPVISDTWKLAAKHAETDGSFIRSKEYIKKVLRVPRDPYESSILELFLFIIDIYEDNPKIFDKSFSSKLTEGDFASIVWSPIIRKILAIRKILRLKFGESVNNDSTKAKQLQYEDANNVIGPKVDMRFVLDLNGAEVDLGAVECARALPSGHPHQWTQDCLFLNFGQLRFQRLSTSWPNHETTGEGKFGQNSGKDNLLTPLVRMPSEDKLHHDETKLLKEGKDVVDGVINRLHEVDLERVQGRIMQIAGLYGEISCVTLSAPGLYVARPVHKVKMPSDLCLLSPLVNTLLDLIETIQVMEDMALLVKQSEAFFEDRRSSFGLKFGRAMGLVRIRNSYQSWLRDTYYFPAKGTRRNSMLPNDFNDIGEPYMDDVDSTHDDGRIPIVGDVDEDGWALLENGRYYNTLIDVYSSEKPT
ncbi:hypothetical protein MBANPS3_004292 [Mucor bainieri]